MSGMVQRHRYQLGQGTAAGALLSGEREGLAIDFTSPRAIVRDWKTPANNFNGLPYDLLTYTSPSAKMTMGPTGTLRFGAHNLIPRSEAFDDAGWSKLNATVTANAAAAPDGTITADRITDDTTNGRHIAYNVSVTGTGIAYYAICLKAGTSQYGSLRITSDSVDYTVNVDLSGGTITQTSTTSGGVASSSITSLGNGWYRVAIFGLNATAVTTFGMVIGVSNSATPTLSSGSPSYVGSGSTIFAWGAQITRTPADTTYLATTSAARYALPYEWDTSGVPQGILVEEARTNVALRSQEFDNASWTKSSATITADATTAPDGTSTADLMTTTAAGAQAFQAITITTAAWTWSVYAKAGNVSYLWFNAQDGSNNITWFNVSNGTVGTNAAGNTATITSVGNGWYRCSLTRTAGSTSGFISFRAVAANNGDSANGNTLYLWGAQVEVGAFATSYIPTVSATVTRAADNISLATSAFPSVATTGTLFAELKDIVAATTYVALSDGSNNNRQILYSGGTTGAYLAQSGGTIQANLDSGATVVNSSVHKMAGAWAANDFQCCVDTTLSAADTSGSIPTPTTMYLGAATGSGPASGTLHIRKLLVVPRRMSNSELQTRTAI